jgi:hypothetical protein
MPPTLDELIATVAALPTPPVAFEAFWDGDTNGWWLDLSAVVPQASGYTAILICCLHGGDTRSFSAQAQDLGAALAACFGLPFYFPSPNNPEDDCPHWWQQDQATPCRRCGIPLLQRPDSRRRGICYFCHLEEEREQRAAALTPEERAGPRCDICGGPALPASGTTIHCPVCRERYRMYECQGCGAMVRTALDYWFAAADRCMRCSARDRLTALPAEQREAIRCARAAQGERIARNMLEDLPGWSFEEALIAVRLLETLPEPTPNEEER